MNRKYLASFSVLSLAVLALAGPLVFAKSAKKGLSPRDTSTFFVSGDEAALEEMTDRSIEELQKLVRRFSQSKNRGEIWLRMAELYVEKSRLVEFREFQKFDKKLADYEKGKTRVRPEVDTSEARVYNKKAIELYEKFVRDFPDDPKLDQALFFLGFNYFALNEPQRGAIFYRQLTQNYPNSPYISESNFALGEYHFDREEWSTSKNYYLKVADDKSARLYLFSLYKAAWCDYRMGQIDRALTSMERVLRESREIQKEAMVEGRKNVNRIKLTSEALHDLIPFYADSKRGYQQAYDYMRKIGGSRLAYDLLEKLAFYYSDTGNKEAARYCFRQLIKERPLSPNAFQYQYQIVNHYVFSAQDSVLKSEFLRWISDYGPSSAWYKANGNRRKMLRDADAVRESTLRNYVLHTHQTAKNSRQALSQQAAVEGYQLYIDSFPQSPHMDLMQFYFGELLFDMKEYDRAARQYSWIFENAPKSPYVEPAVINSTIAIEKSLPSEKELRKRVGKKTEPVPFAEDLKRFERSAAKYIEAFPNGEKRVLITFKLARLHYIHNHFDEALAGFKEVVQREPKTKLGEYAANLILDIYNLKKDYTGLQKAGEELIKGGVSAKVGDEIQGIMEKSSFKTAQTLEQQGNYIESAKGYERFAAENPTSPLAASAIFNAAVNFSRVGDVFASARLFSLFTQKHGGKNKKLDQEANETLVKLYVDTAQYHKAGRQYKRLTALYPTSPLVARWLFNAATIWDGLGYSDLAVRDYTLYYEKEKKKEREEAWFYIAEIQRNKGARKSALQSYEKFLAHSPSSAEKVFLASFYVAELKERLSSWAEAKKAYQKFLGVGRSLKGKKIERRDELVAKASFQLSLEVYRRFIGIQVPASEKAQKQALAAKLKALEDLKKAMKEVIDLKYGEQILASLVTLGRAYWNMYSFFRKIPLPKGLNAEQAKEYRKQVFLQTKPFKDSAVQYYDEALAFSQKAEVYGEWLETAREESATLKGARELRFAESGRESKSVDWMNL